MVDPLGLTANDWIWSGPFAGIAIASDALAGVNARNAGRAYRFGCFDGGQFLFDVALGYGAGKLIGLGWRLGSRSPFLRKLLADESGGVPIGHSAEKQALVEMAKMDKRLGLRRSDMEAYKDLNRQLPDPFPSGKVRTDEGHSRGGPHSQVPHGHVGPVNHIPIIGP
jgi:hypothetical protein